MKTKKEFADIVRKKWPGYYDNKSDDEIVNAFIKKYPQYKTTISDLESDAYGNTNKISDVLSTQSEWDKFPCVKNGVSGIKLDSTTNTYGFQSSNPDYGTVSISLDGRFTSNGPKVKSGTWKCLGDGRIYLEHDNVITPDKPQPVNITTDNVKNGTLVKIGARGQVVDEIQQMLIAVGGKLNNPIIKKISESGVPDEKYGPLTKAAVTEFQRVSGIGVDGIVGPETLSKLQSSMNDTPTASVETPTPTPAPISESELKKQIIKETVNRVLNTKYNVKNSVKKVLEETILKK